MYRATKAKVLWLHILEVHRSAGDLFLPQYMREPTSLSSSEIEAFVRRSLRLNHLWSGETLSPKRTVRLDLPRMVDWLKLVSGRWLFVASSDNYSSEFSCWDVSSVLTVGGSPEPLAQCFLPGRVNSGFVEVQQDGVVIALGVGPS